MSWTTEYDREIQIQAGAFLPWNWMWLKAQLIAESDLNPNAVSPVGAKGLPQFMDPTWLDMQRELNLPICATPFQPEYAIRAAAYYMSKLRLQWAKVDRKENERRALAQASYNAGLGNILKAQKLANGAPGYNEIIAQLHKVTGEKNAAETRGYVERIGRIYTQLSTAGRAG